MPTHAKYESRKVAGFRLTALAQWILQYTGVGIERGQIAEGFFGISRFYRGWYVDPCLSPKERGDHNAVYRRIQPVITKTLKQLESLALVVLIRRHRYVKKVRSTEQGERLADRLNNIINSPGHDN